MNPSMREAVDQRAAIAVPGNKLFRAGVYNAGGNFKSSEMNVRVYDVPRFVNATSGAVGFPPCRYRYTGKNTSCRLWQLSYRGFSVVRWMSVA